jgi:Tol biopolymer transport system component
MIIRSVNLIVFTLIFSGAVAQVVYPGRQLAADTPAVFAPGILTDGLSNRDFTISPAGDEIFFTLQQPRFASSTILHLIFEKGKWSKPEVASFSGRYRDLEAAFSPDGQTVYFSSDRPQAGSKGKDFDIWKVMRKADGHWGEPENLGEQVNSGKNEFYPSVAKNGNLYFTVEAAYGKGSEDIVCCTRTNAGYNKPESLPRDINTQYDEFNAFINPNERYILFSSYGRPDDMGGGDLYISCKNKEGKWMPAKHLPSPVNSVSLDYCPFVTPDEKYLVFTSNRISLSFKDTKVKSYQQLKDLLSSPGNGFDDIYLMKFDTSWLK